MSYHLLGRFPAAHEAYERAIKADSAAAAPRNNLGALLYSQRKFSEADREFRRAAERDGDNPILSKNLHRSRYARDNSRDAREPALDAEITRRLLLDPLAEYPGEILAVASLIPPAKAQQAAAHYTRGDIFTARKMYEDAVIEYKRSLAVDRYDSAVVNRLGIAYHNLQKYRDSEQQYREALRLRPNHVDYMNNLAVIEYIRSDYESALLRYRAIIKLKPDAIKALRNLGACLFAMERWEEGIAVYQRALALKPDLFAPQPSGAGASVQMSQKNSALMHFYFAKVFALRGEVDTAISYLFKAVDAGFQDLKMLRDEEAFLKIAADERFERVLKSIAEKKSGND
jgi:tetratricopeptide (TPR) repeat protein